MKYIASKQLILLTSDSKQRKESKSPSLQTNLQFLPARLLSSLRKECVPNIFLLQTAGSTFETVCVSAITFQICWTSARSNTGYYQTSVWGNTVTAWIASEANSFPARCISLSGLGAPQTEVPKQLRSPEMFNPNLSAKVFDGVCHSGKDRLYPGPLSSRVNMVLWVQEDVNRQRWAEQSWEAPVGVTVRRWLSQLQSPRRRHVEALATLKSNAFDIVRKPVRLPGRLGGTDRCDIWEPKRWLLLVVQNSVRPFLLLITIIYVNPRIDSWYLKRNAMGIFPMSAHGTSAVYGEKTDHTKQWSVYSMTAFFFFCFLVGAEKPSEPL